MKPVSLLGGTGFIGSHYARMYSNDTVVEMRECLSPSQDDVLYFVSTTSNYNVLKPETLKLDVETNLCRLLDVLPNVRGVFNWTGTWFSYGANDWGHHPAWRAKESHLCNPNGLYSISKTAAEQVIRSYTQTVAAVPYYVNGPTAYRILRLSNVIGNDPRADKTKNALEMMLSKVLRGKMVEIYEGPIHRDILHVEDTCRAIRLCLERPETLNTIVNIGRGESHSMEDLIRYAIDATGSKSQIVKVPVPAFHQVVQVPSFYMDTTKLRTLGFKPQYSIEKSIDMVLDGLVKRFAL